MPTLCRGHSPRCSSLFCFSPGCNGCSILFEDNWSFLTQVCSSGKHFNGTTRGGAGWWLGSESSISSNIRPDTNLQFLRPLDWWPCINRFTIARIGQGECAPACLYLTTLSSARLGWERSQTNLSITPSSQIMHFTNTVKIYLYTWFWGGSWKSCLMSKVTKFAADKSLGGTALFNLVGQHICSLAHLCLHWWQVENPGSGPKLSLRIFP